MAKRKRKQILPIPSEKRVKKQDEIIPTESSLRQRYNRLGIDILKQDNRYIYDPVDEVIVRFIKQAQAAHWVTEEIDLMDDLREWNKTKEQGGKLSDGDRAFISNVLAFFAASDGIVNENLALRFYKDVQLAEARFFYGVQINMECIHAETYSRLLDTFISDKLERQRLFDGINTIPSIKKKADWAIRWLEDETSCFAERLVAFAAVEGIFFSGSFCSLFWIRERGILPGLSRSNKMIWADETLHCKFAIYLLSHVRKTITDARITEIVCSAIECEKEFVKDTLRVDLVGMNSRSMSQYIEFVGDQMLHMFDVPKVYHSTNPFDWMEKLALDEKANLFEIATDYQKSYSGSKGEKRVLDIDADF